MSCYNRCSSTHTKLIRILDINAAQALKYHYHLVKLSFTSMIPCPLLLAPNSNLPRYHLDASAVQALTIQFFRFVFSSRDLNPYTPQALTSTMKVLRTGHPHKLARFYGLALTSNIAGKETDTVQMLRIIVVQDHKELETKDPVPDTNSHSSDAGADQTPIRSILLHRLEPKDPKPPPLTPIPDGEPNSHRHGQIIITHQPRTLPAPSCLQSMPTVVPYVVYHFGLF